MSAPIKSPANVYNTSKKDTSLTFSWDQIQCGYRGGDILRYKYQLTDGEDSLIKEDEVEDMTVLLTGLEPCVEYSFVVAGITNAGTGPMSLPVRTETSFAGTLITSKEFDNI